MVILFDQFNMPKDVYGIIFATEQQGVVAKLLIDYMKTNNSEIGRTEMSLFATQLHNGEIVTTIDLPPYAGRRVKLSYNKRQFYDRIVTPMKSMGLIEYDLYKKTYRLTDRFNKLMIKIGLEWLQELKRPPLPLKIKEA
ncbi:hypothetical protein COT48_05770 [Candidatus Woesearchaeota archaeon CG08_land_8_20_14_0_20_47_9]|nr:MAG: hypothetical protein AUJ69_03975 [Candidatus Woesearchaeota archaeon CG1_02_47_18]PIO03237.1 MAG: hypothetical protein COT48_05770 [Candidatus Woesearchaeota archaeon CG08_land_8_20_14_0_20_47_9]HII29471.1 hypothetical protein [Candidatus Woesearchaeota archaeon]